MPDNESPYGELRVFDISPEGATSFGGNVAKILEKPTGPVVKKFRDEETDIMIKTSVRGRDVYVFQSYVPPIGERLYELDLFLDAVKGGGFARRATVVFPYAFGSRGERRTRSRQPVPSLVTARNMKANGADKVMAVDIHTTAIGTIYNAANLEFEHLEFEYLVANYILNHVEGDIVLASPDAGGTKRVQKVLEIIEHVNQNLRKRLGEITTAYADKRRPKANESIVYGVTGDVKGKPVYIIDDIVDTLGTLVQAAGAIRDRGAKELTVMACHPVLSQGAQPNLEKLMDSGIADTMILGNTIPVKDYAMSHPKVRIIPLEPLVAAAIKKLHTDDSISELHQYPTIVEAYQNGADKLYGKDPKFVRIK